MCKLRPKQDYIDLGYRFVITKNNWKLFYGERQLGGEVTPTIGKHWTLERKQFQDNAAAAMNAAAKHLDGIELQLNLDQFIMNRETV